MEEPRDLAALEPALRSSENDPVQLALPHGKILRVLVKG